jgi:hypothetical protein
MQNADSMIGSIQRLHTRALRLLTFNATEKGTLLKCALLLPLFWLGLRTMGFASFRARLQRSRIVTGPAIGGDEIMRLAELVNIAARHHPLPATCLSRSLLLGWLLHRRGVITQLRLGARIADGKLDAHAWVEWAGVPVNDEADVALRYPALSQPVGKIYS